MKYLFFLVLIILLSVANGFTQSADSTKNNTDSLSTEDSTTASKDLTRSTQDSTQFNTFKYFWKPGIYLPLNSTLTFTFRSPARVRKWKALSSGSEILSKFGNINFQGSTAFQLVYADEFYKAEVLKPDYGNAFIVPILPMAFLALYGAQKGFLALKKDPPISFDKVDVEIMDIIRENSGLTAVDCYQKYSEMNLPGNLTFMTLQRRLDKLMRQRVIYSREEGENKTRYTLLRAREELLQILDEELRKDEPNQHPARIVELQRMKTLLLGISSAK